MWVKAGEEHILAFMCLFCLHTGNEQQSGVLRIKHKHTQTRKHSHSPWAGCDMLSEMLLFKVMRLASEPFSSGEEEDACNRLIKMAQLNRNVTALQNGSLNTAGALKTEKKRPDTYHHTSATC